MYGFEKWMRLREWADFGLLEPAVKPPRYAPPDDQPARPVDVEYVCRDLKRHRLGVKEPQEQFFGEVRWGSGPGSLQLFFSPFGSFSASVRKLCTDLEGRPVWVCKKVVEVRNFYDRKEDSLSVDLYQILNEIDSTDIDAPMANYKGLEKLVLDVAALLKRNNTQQVLLYEGVRVVKENREYIIHFGATGHGVQRRGQKRLDQFCIFMQYLPEHGIIRVNGLELGSAIQNHDWQYDPSVFQEIFMPTQPHEEIAKCILAHLNSY